MSKRKTKNGQGGLSAKIKKGVDLVHTNPEPMRYRVCEGGRISRKTDPRNLDLLEQAIFNNYKVSDEAVRECVRRRLELKPEIKAFGALMAWAFVWVFTTLIFYPFWNVAIPFITNWLNSY